MTLAQATDIRSRINALRGLLPRIAPRYVAETEQEIAELNARLADAAWL